MKLRQLAFATVCSVTAFLPAGAAPITPLDRGATIETERYRVEIRDAVVTGFLNKLTNEEYLRRDSRLENIVPFLPSGLGTQHGAEAFAAAAQMHRWPWNELPADFAPVCQQYPVANSRFEFKSNGPAAATLIYTGLQRDPAAVYELQVAVDEATGDLLLTPVGRSPKPGVFAISLTVAPTLPVISIEAPIFDGVRLTGDMRTGTWVNKWPDFWDYQFVALNGERRGAVGIWAQDAQWHYKHLFYRPSENGIALAFATMNPPPFDKLTTTTAVTWRLQAFDTSWTQAAARFRAWREQAIQFAPRPEWTQRISFVNSGVNASLGWLTILSNYFGGVSLDRTVTFAATIRAQGFDQNHWDNSAYPKFAEEMPAWKTSGAKLMAYLQPMIMWGVPPADNAAGQQVFDLHRRAHTVSAFSAGKGFLHVDQHNLGQPDWQEWFLGCVKHFIELGADGVYHDQSYPCPVDNRGLINGKTSAAGMADYFYKAATQNPNTLHGSEHMQEANSIGTSLGIGSGVLWGSAPGMRRQRIANGSPISNALHYPRGALWAFPHYSEFGRGDATIFHWGMDLMERRGDLAGLHLQRPQLYNGQILPFPAWRNEIKLDRHRALLFVQHGLRPTFPEQWDRTVRTYFTGAQGEDFRYVTTPWGSQFVQVSAGQEQVHYGRAHGATHAATAAGIAGWIFFNDQGPAGLHPDRYYYLDPAVPRPPVYFAPAFTMVPETPVFPTFYESYVEDGYATDSFAFLRVRPLATVGNIIKSDKITLHSPHEPKAIFINGKPGKFKSLPTGGYEIGFQSPANIFVLLTEPAAGLTNLAATARTRWISNVNLDLTAAEWLTSGLANATVKLPGGATAPGVKLTVSSPIGGGHSATQWHIPVRAPAQAGKLRVHVTGGSITEFAVNGQPVTGQAAPYTLAFGADETKIISTIGQPAAVLGFEWADDN